jgi:hypothetical protein
VPLKSSSEHVLLMTRLAASPPLVLSTDLFETGFEPAHVMLDEPLCPLPGESSYLAAASKQASERAASTCGDG